MFKKYRRTNIAEMMEWTPSASMDRVSISQTDIENGSPKEGDMIAHNPENNDDRWLVAADYFKENFAPIPANETYLDRLYIERNELEEKLIKLQNALEDNLVPPNAVDILTLQSHTMRQYLYVLNHRLSGETDDKIEMAKNKDKSFMTLGEMLKKYDEVKATRQ